MFSLIKNNKKIIIFLYSIIVQSTINTTITVRIPLSSSNLVRTLNPILIVDLGKNNSTIEPQCLSSLLGRHPYCCTRIPFQLNNPLRPITASLFWEKAGSRENSGFHSKKHAICFILCMQQINICTDVINIINNYMKTDITISKRYMIGDMATIATEGNNNTFLLK